MDAELKMDSKEYQELEEDARKALETLSPEKIQDLRNTAVSGLASFISYLEQRVDNCYKNLNNLEEFKRENYNPFRKPVIWFLVCAAFFFIASIVFKVPTELLWVNFPAGIAAIVLYVKFRSSGKEFDDQFFNIYTSALNLFAALLEYMNTIYENISADDVKLMIFCHSCEEFKLPLPKLYINHDYDQIANLLYNNNISFQPGTFVTKVKSDTLFSQISSLIETIQQKMECVFDTAAVRDPEPNESDIDAAAADRSI